MMKRDTSIMTRLSQEEKDFVKAQAEAAGLRPSAYVRALATNHTIRSKVDVAILNELRRLGGLCKHLFNNGADSSATSTALKELEAAAARLAPK